MYIKKSFIVHTLYTTITQSLFLSPFFYVIIPIIRIGITKFDFSYPVYYNYSVYTSFCNSDKNIFLRICQFNFLHPVYYNYAVFIFFYLDNCTLMTNDITQIFTTTLTGYYAIGNSPKRSLKKN